jgi:hypothetical protein
LELQLKALPQKASLERRLTLVEEDQHAQEREHLLNEDNLFF